MKQTVEKGKCPDCNSELMSTKHAGMFECPNLKCHVITVWIDVRRESATESDGTIFGKEEKQVTKERKEITAKEFIESYFGKRCIEYEEGCSCCAAWKHFDECCDVTVY